MRLSFSKSLKSLPDAELIQLYQQTSDGKYFGELFTRYTHLVFGTSMKYLKNVEDSKDAVVQIFEKLLQDLKSYKVDNFKGWLYQVSKNHCLMQLRKEKSVGRKSEEYTIEVKNNVEYEQAVHLIDEEQNQEVKLEQLSGALNQLQDKQKQCLELFYLQEMSYQQVADTTKFSLKEVKSYIQNGKKNLKKLLITISLTVVIFGGLLKLIFLK